MTTTEVINFDFRNNDVRVIEKDGEPWFVAADVCRALGIMNASKATRDLAPDRKYNFKLGLPGKAPVGINEAGLYDLILQSRKPEAREFKHWVTGTVLPSIRKHGTYVEGQEQYFAGNLTAQEMVQRGTEAMASLLDTTQAQQVEKVTSS